MERLTRLAGNGFETNCECCPKHGCCNDSADCVEVLTARLAMYEEAESTGRFIRFPFVAMVEQSLQNGVMTQTQREQGNNGRYAVVYNDPKKWGCPLIDICGTPYNREQAEARRAELHGTVVKENAD